VESFRPSFGSLVPSFSFVSTDRPAQNSASPDDLPPVQPPSAGFLVQLFLVPGIIVAIIVVVWVMVDWLAHMESDPQKYVDGLRRDTPDVWQKAEQLAEMLRSDRSNQLKGNAKLAETLGEILDEKLKAGLMDEGSINLRIYLSSALGQFNIPEAMPALLKAASTNRDPKELPVRRAALDAIGMLAWNLQQIASAASPKGEKRELLYRTELTSTLLGAARDPEPVIRLRAAFVLGIVGGEQASDRLKRMLDDPNREVSYNAATALARYGDPAAIDTLLKMLDPEPFQHPATEAAAKAPAGEHDDPDRQTDPTVVILNGLRGISHLADANPAADLSRLTAAVDRLRDASFPLEIRDMALSLHSRLAKRPQSAASASR
jgi:HEAT repeats